MDSWSNFYDRQTAPEEQQLYNHLLDCVKSEPPSKILRRFQALFIEGVGYTDPQVWWAITKIVASRQAEQEFKFILYRCCHILINTWSLQPRLHLAIPKLVALFELTPSGLAQSQTAQRIRGLVQRFKHTDQYRALDRLAQVMIHQTELTLDPETQPIGTLLRRYPYLYEHCLVVEGSTRDQRQKIQVIRKQNQRQLEFDLSRYVTAQFQRSRSEAIKNPTLLSDRQLELALIEFTGKVESSNTYRDTAQKFLTYSKQSRSYLEFKENVYDYLAAAIEVRSGSSRFTHQFNERLYTQLQNIMPESDAQQLHDFDFLLLRTCTKLLNFLVVESPHQLHHYVFVDLTQNIGVTYTIGLLLKIVLLCRKVRPYLEKLFSILFNHYEAHTRGGVLWLVDSMENLNVALSTNFGDMNLCYTGRPALVL